MNLLKSIIIVTFALIRVKSFRFSNYLREVSSPHSSKVWTPKSPLSGHHVPTSSTHTLKMGASEALVGVSLPVQGFLLNSVLASILKIKGTDSLTDAGLFHAFLLGWGLWSTLGVAGWVYGVAYFVFGVAVTKVKMAEKESLGIAEKRGGARGPENVWGSAGTAMICAIASINAPTADVARALNVGFAASLATKLSDTFGSEIGKAYGKTCYLITTFKLVQRGTEGAVSVEGTLAGVVASIIMAAISVALGLISGSSAIAAVIIAALVATTVESYIGAIFQDNVPWLTNELVNFVNTLIGAAIAMLLVTVA
jgi:uncharacterized protein (TIGR00297 family)